jgi:NhaP-type Na+/H+ or K+/H+ antiporter
VLLGLFVGLLFVYSLVSGRLERTVITAPIVFTLGGMLAWLAPAWVPGLPDDSGVFLPLAEIGLVLLLFTDASRTDLNVLQSIRNLPARLLSTGMLLTILLGAVAARLVLPGLSW